MKLTDEQYTAINDILVEKVRENRFQPSFTVDDSIIESGIELQFVGTVQMSYDYHDGFDGGEDASYSELTDATFYGFVYGWGLDGVEKIKQTNIIFGLTF